MVHPKETKWRHGNLSHMGTVKMTRPAGPQHVSALLVSVAKFVVKLFQAPGMRTAGLTELAATPSLTK